MTHCPPRRILVAVDFGDASAAGVTLAGRLASRLGSALEALHAETFDVPPYFTREQFARLEGELRAARTVAEASLRRFVQMHTDTAATVRVVDKPPVEAVLEAAADTDLVVVGTHGRRGPKRWWLGSVAERVVREAPVPVLVVHAPGGGTAPETREVIVLAGTPARELRAWAEVVARAIDGVVRQGPPADRCEGTAMSPGGIVAVAVENAPTDRAVHRSVAALARTCPAPVLFVPITSEAVAPV